MPVALIPRGSSPDQSEISLRVRPEEPFLLLKYILTLSLILCSYRLFLVNTLSCKYNYFPHISWFVLLLLLLVFTNQNTTLWIQRCRSHRRITNAQGCYFTYILSEEKKRVFLFLNVKWTQKPSDGIRTDTWISFSTLISIAAPYCDHYIGWEFSSFNEIQKVGI